MALTINIDIDKGADFSKILTVKDSTGVAVDIANKTFSGAIKRTRYFSGANSVSFTITKQSPSADGKIKIDLTDVETDGLIAENQVYDIIMTDTGTGLKTVVFTGLAIIRPRVKE